jgi:hypothetical protein
MAVLNPSFETPGANPGEAEHWTLSTYTSKERIAGFGPEPFRAQEDFERWVDLLTSLDQTAIGFFDPLLEGYEDFEEGWQNDVYLTELPTGHVAVAPFDGGAVEDMEDGWSNAPYAWSWDDVTASTGMFDGEPREDFEENWRSNENYAWDWSAVSSATGYFDSGTDPNEDFENDWTVMTTL